jgi:hypothetical protein
MNTEKNGEKNVHVYQTTIECPNHIEWFEEASVTPQPRRSELFVSFEVNRI